jgi:hypothetical protein
MADIVMKFIEENIKYKSEEEQKKGIYIYII